MTFTHGDGTEPVGNFVTSINWGDGTTTAGTVTQSGTSYLLKGSHTYTQPGSFSVRIVVSDDGQNTFLNEVATIGPELLPNATTGTPNQEFVAKAVRELLQREVDTATLNLLSGLLDAGLTRFQIVQAIENAPSGEFQAVEVREVYHKYLRRDPDPLGLQGGVAFLRGGGTVEQLSAVLLNSPEYYTRIGGGTDSGFLRALFLDTEGTDIGNSASAGISLADPSVRLVAAEVVLASDAFLQNRVRSLFAEFQAGTPDATTVAFVVAALRGGFSEAALIALLVAQS
jgi:hypothetical protein